MGMVNTPAKKDDKGKEQAPAKEPGFLEKYGYLLLIPVLVVLGLLAIIYTRMKGRGSEVPATPTVQPIEAAKEVAKAAVTAPVEAVKAAAEPAKAVLKVFRFGEDD